MRVQVVSRKLIAPSSPTPEHLRSLKISYFDQVANYSYVPRIFYYLPNPEEEGLGAAEKSEQVQKSLAETLTFYYPLAGRYMKEKLLVDCNDEGAEYAEAQVSGCLSQLLGEGGGEFRSELLNQLVPKPVEDSNSTPLALFQFNKFECGGVAIAVCLAHRVTDGNSGFTFIDTWAKVSRMGAGKTPFRPSFQLGTLFPPREIAAPKKKLGAAGGDTLVMKRLVFNAAAIAKLKAIATSSTSNVNDSEPLKYTRLEVVTAFIWMSLIRLDRAKYGRLRPSILSIPINMRKKTNLPVPDNACGNFLNRTVPKFFPDEDGNTKLQLHDLAVTVHDATKRSIANLSKASTPDDIISLVKHANEEMLTGLDNPDVNCCVSTSWCRFPIYEADFGWGKPYWVSSAVIPVFRNAIVLSDTKDGDGIEAAVVLDQNSMNLYQQDSDIKPFFG